MLSLLRQFGSVLLITQLGRGWMQGNTNGLDEEVVAYKISRMEILANQVLQEPTDKLLALFHDR